MRINKYTYLNNMLSIECDKKEAIDDLGIRIINEYNIPGIVKFKDTNIVNNGKIMYNTVGYVLISDRLKSEISKKELLMMIKEVCIVLDNCTSFMLDEKQFILDKELCFIDNATNEIELVYYPVIQETTDEEFGLTAFIKELLLSARFRMDEDGSYVMKIINYLNSSNTLTIDNIMTFIDEMNQSDERVKLNNEEPNDVSVEVAERNAVNQTVQNQSEGIAVPMEDLARILREGNADTKSNSSVGETMILDGFAEPNSLMPYLIRSKNNEKIIINKDVFVLGKSSQKANYHIGDNTAISRAHAQIICENGEYYAQDLGSTNHTYVNGNMLGNGQKQLLKHKDVIKLADEAFVINMI